MSDFTGSGMSESEADFPTSGAAAPAPSASPGLISSASAPSSGRVFDAWAESTEQASAAPEPSSEVAAPKVSVELTAVECRVIGAMIEKSFLTPDIYPMTTNSLVTACNQKTNRDPVVDFSAVLIDTTLMELRERNLVRRVHSPGARSTKHRQTLDEALHLNEQQLALISVLLLRGPQTFGELRLRTERHDVGFGDLGAVEACLEGLARRASPLVRELPRQPGHKENRWQHLLSHIDPAEDPMPGVSETLSRLDDRPAASPQSASADAQVLTERVDQLEAQVATLQQQLASLADKLGEPLE